MEKQRLKLKNNGSFMTKNRRVFGYRNWNEKVDDEVMGPNDYLNIFLFKNKAQRVGVIKSVFWISECIDYVTWLNCNLVDFGWIFVIWKVQKSASGVSLILH